MHVWLYRLQNIHNISYIFIGYTYIICRLFCTYIHSIYYSYNTQKILTQNLSVWCSSRSANLHDISQTFFWLSRRNSFTGTREIFLISSKRIKLSKILFSQAAICISRRSEAINCNATPLITGFEATK